jgi:tetratricopeptide (TPR) repeat protein
VIEQLLRAENALALGLLDQAEQIYAQTLTHDPANAIAVVGLSRVALERGDERASLDLARRALSIDPENAQAGRMADRLEEVMRERGDAIPPAALKPAAIDPGAMQPAALPPGAVGRMAVSPDASPTTAARPVAAPKRRGFLRRLTGRS